jgi:NAD(P)-dependent dehydrogenase (short-subunit alcohol dehydrogenase family)
MRDRSTGSEPRPAALRIPSMQLDRFAGEVVVVTGGASGLGRGLVEALARAGAKLVVGDIDLATASALCDELTRAGKSATAVHVDVTDSGSVERLVEQAIALHGRLDYLFNNAGIAAAGEFHEMSADTIRRVVEIDLLGAAYGTLAAYRQMVRQRGGHIVNIGSMLALFPNPLSAAYVAAKHGLAGLTQSVSAEAAAYGVSLTLICPGYIATNLFKAGTFEGSLRSDNVLERIPFRLIDVDTAVARTLQAVLARKSIAVFPFYGRVLWWIHRFSPRLMVGLLRLMMNNQSRRFGTGDRV